MSENHQYKEADEKWEHTQNLQQHQEHGDKHRKSLELSNAIILYAPVSVDSTLMPPCLSPAVSPLTAMHQMEADDTRSEKKIWSASL